MSPELIGILGVGVTLLSVSVVLSGILITGQRSLRQEFRKDVSELRQSQEDLRAELRQDLSEIRQDIADLRERMARLEGLFEGFIQQGKKTA